MTSVGEFKTKPTQHSVRTLQGLGLQPDIIICRAERKLTDAAEKKIALFCNVPQERVISNPDIPIIYQLPLSFENQGLGDTLTNHLGMKLRVPDTKSWQEIVSTFRDTSKTIRIAMPGKYTMLSDSYKSINEALTHAAAWCGVKVEIKWIETEERCDEECLIQDLNDVDGILLTPGFGERGVTGMVNAAMVSFESQIPFLGICYGAQLGVIAYARKIMGWDGAHTTEVDSDSLYPVIDLMDEQKQIDDKGGTMRLGGHTVVITKNTQLHKLYGKTEVRERFRHRYHFIDRYIGKMQKTGMIVSAVNKEGNIINAVELQNHPFWVGVQYHPEFKSQPGKPHPLYLGLIKAAMDYNSKRGS